MSESKIEHVNRIIKLAFTFTSKMYNFLQRFLIHSFQKSLLLFQHLRFNLYLESLSTMNATRMRGGHKPPHCSPARVFPFFYPLGFVEQKRVHFFSLKLNPSVTGGRVAERRLCKARMEPSLDLTTPWPSLQFKLHWSCPLLCANLSELP